MSTTEKINEAAQPLLDLLKQLDLEDPPKVWHNGRDFVDTNDREVVEATRILCREMLRTVKTNGYGGCQLCGS